MRNYKTATDYADIGLEIDENNDVWFSVRITTKDEIKVFEHFYRTKDISVIESIKESCDQAIKRIKESESKKDSKNPEW